MTRHYLILFLAFLCLLIPGTSHAESTTCPTLSYSLYRGITDAQSGGEVSRLQQFLASNGDIYPNGQVTGYFGPLTEAAVQRLQALLGVVSYGTPWSTGYGRVGAMTRSAITNNCTSVQSTSAQSGIIEQTSSVSVTVDPISTEATPMTLDPLSESYGIFVIKFSVTANDADWYLTPSAADGGTFAGAIYAINGATSTGTLSERVLTSTAERVNGDYVVREGDTEDFTITLYFDPPVDGRYSMSLLRVNVHPRPDMSGTDSVSVKGRTGFTTNEILIPNSSSVVGTYISGTINGGTFTTANPTITGTAKGTKMVGLWIDNGFEKEYGSGTTIAVDDGHWSHRVADSLPDGSYTVHLAANNIELDKEAITVRTASSATVRILAPNGGETAQVGPGQSLTVIWEGSGLTSSMKALLTLVNDLGQSFVFAGSDVCPPSVNGKNTCTRTIPSYIVPGSYLAKVEVVDTSTGKEMGVATDTGDGLFLLVSTTVTDTYRFYLNGNLAIQTQGITLGDALNNCTLNAANNQTSSIKCTWGSKVIYERGAVLGATTDADTQALLQKLQNLIDEVKQLL